MFAKITFVRLNSETLKFRLFLIKNNIKLFINAVQKFKHF